MTSYYSSNVMPGYEKWIWGFTDALDLESALQRPVVQWRRKANSSLKVMIVKERLWWKALEVQREDRFLTLKQKGDLEEQQHPQTKCFWCAKSALCQAHRGRLFSSIRSLQILSPGLSGIKTVAFTTLHCGLYGEGVFAEEEARMKDLCLTKKPEKQRYERRWDLVLTLCVFQVPSSQRKRKREGRNHRLWNQAWACSRTARRWVQTLCPPHGLLTSGAHTALMFLSARRGLRAGFWLLQQPFSPSSSPGFYRSGKWCCTIIFSLTVASFLFCSSSSSSCSRRRSFCQLLQPPPQWTSSCSEHRTAPASWYCPTPSPR